MDNYIVRESKLVLIIGILGTAFFLPLYFLGLWYASFYIDDFGGFLGLVAIFTLVFGNLSFCGIYLILSYFRRKLVIGGGMLSYTPAIGRTRSFHCSDIGQITLDIQTSVKLRSHDGKRLAVFELNMLESVPALSYLESLGIPAKKSRLAERLSENKQTYLEEEKNYILSRWDDETIAREKRIARIIYFVLAALLLLAFLMPQKLMFSGFVFILLFCYGMYLFFYPKMTVEVADSCHISFPLSICLIDILLLYVFERSLNMECTAFTVVSILILTACYLWVLLVQKRKERIQKRISVLLAVMLLSFFTAPAINVAATFQPGTHETVTVLDKRIDHSSGDNYHLVVEVQGTPQSYAVSKEMYSSIAENDTVTLCRRQSIFHVTWIVLHSDQVASTYLG